MELQSGNAKFWSKSAIFLVPCDIEIKWMILKSNRAPLLCYFKFCVSFHSLLWNLNEVTVRKHQIWVKSGDCFVPCDLEIWQMTLENNRAPFLFYFNLSASFRSHLWIGVAVWKRQIWVKIGEFLSHVTLKFDGCLWKKKAPLLCHFKLCATFHSHLWIQNWVTVQKRQIWVKIGDFFARCDLEISLMTLKNNRAPLLCYFKLCASLHSHPCIQTGVTFWKRLN